MMRRGIPIQRSPHGVAYEVNLPDEGRHLVRTVREAARLIDDYWWRNVADNPCQWVGLSPDGETVCTNEADAGRYCTRHAAVARSYNYAEAVNSQ